MYCDVTRIKDDICVRGYTPSGERYQRRVPFKPTMYLPSSDPTDWRTLGGVHVAPVICDSMSDASRMVKEYEGVARLAVFGMDNYVTQFVEQAFPGDFKYDITSVNVVSFDIEVYSPDGFPHASEAQYPVVSIAAHSSKFDQYILWATKDFTPTQETPTNLTFVRCDDEHDLLSKFLSWWEGSDTSPDVVTGWNVKLFDIPYLVNRIRQTMGEAPARRLSPWGFIREHAVQIGNRSNQAFVLAGIQILDYIELYRKFAVLTLGVPESYKLDHIASLVLGRKKLSYDEHRSLHSLYDKDPNRFFDYNIRDTELIVEMDRKLQLITLAITIAYKAGAQYTDAFGTTAVWDALIYRSLNQRGIVVPPKIVGAKQNLDGAYVKTPQLGRHKWVASFDLNSLYPMTMIQYNMSPETIVDTYSDLTPEKILETDGQAAIDSSVPNCTTAANGIHYTTNQKGIIPELIDKLYSDRSQAKKAKIELDKKVQRARNPETKAKLEKERDQLDSAQMAFKILMNSCYGAHGSPYFRYFDMRTANAITSCGRLTIRWAEKAINELLNKILKTDNVDYVIAADTDSLYINMGPLVDMMGIGDRPEDEVVTIIDQICNDKFEPHLDQAYVKLGEVMSAFSLRMKMKREVIASGGIWVAKKRYTLLVHDDEGVRYETPKLKIMGIEAVKSSTPQVCRDKLKEVFRLLVKGKFDEAMEFCEQFREDFRQLEPHEVASPRSANNISKWQDSQTIYGKGTPIHIKGSLLYNNFIEQVDETGNQFPRIGDGEKIKFIPLLKPNPIRDTVISFPDYLPEELNLHKYLDYNSQFEKTFMSVVDHMIEAAGWSRHPTLDAFFT